MWSATRFCSSDTPLLYSRIPCSLGSPPGFLLTPYQPFSKGWVLQYSALNLLLFSTLPSSRITSPICVLNPSTQISLAPHTEQAINQTPEYFLKSAFCCLPFSKWHDHPLKHNLFLLVSPVVSSSKISSLLWLPPPLLCWSGFSRETEQMLCASIQKYLFFPSF